MDGPGPQAGYAGPVTTEEPTAQSPSTGEGERGHAVGRSAAEALGAPAPTEPVHVPTRTIVLVGTAAWTLALVLTLLVPELRTGERSWWPWTCVTGIALGAFALWYVGRGKDGATDL